MTRFYCVNCNNMAFTVKGEVFRFENGIIETDNEELIAELEASPYATTQAPNSASSELPPEIQAILDNKQTEPSDLMYYKLASRMSVADAKRYADERGIAYPEDVVKEELIDAINLAQQDRI